MNSPPCPQFCVGSGAYFMTVSLKPDLYKWCARKQLKLTFDKLSRYIKIYSNKFLMVAELTKKNNIHYHIIIHFNDILYADTLLMETLKTSNEFGNTMINEKVITETQRTFEYCVKDINKTYTIVNKVKYGKPGYTLLYDVYTVHNVEKKEIIMMEIDTSSLDEGISIDDFLINY